MEDFFKKKEKQQELSPVGAYGVVECVGEEMGSYCYLMQPGTVPELLSRGR